MQTRAFERYRWLLREEPLMNMLMTIFIRASCQSNIHLLLNHPAVRWGWISICPCSFSEWLYESSYFYMCVSLCCPPQPLFLHPFLAGVQIKYWLNNTSPDLYFSIIGIFSMSVCALMFRRSAEMKLLISPKSCVSPNLCWDEGLSDPNMLESSGQGAI